MNRDEAFELQLSRWLEEGPYEAPKPPVAAAVQFVRAHPTRRALDGGLWRRIVSGIGLTQVPSQPRPRWLPVGVGAVVVALVVVGGYGLFNLNQGIGPGGASPTPVVTSAPTPTATAAPTPRPTRTPTPTLGPGMATGTQTCAETTPDVTTEVDGVVQSRGRILDCSNTSSDPRLAGEASVNFNWDEHPDGLWLGWGTIEVRNEGGAWNGSYAMESTSSASVMEWDSLWIGSGGYAGLEVLNHVRMVAGGATTLTSRVIEAGTVIKGTEACIRTSAGEEFKVGEVTAYRGVTLRCTDTMDDPRVSGAGTLAVSIDMRVDESADIWGTYTPGNPAGAWEGFFFGTVDAGYTTHHAQALLRGSGAYEGLLYRLEVDSPDGRNATLTGEIIPGF